MDKSKWWFRALVALVATAIVLGAGWVVFLLATKVPWILVVLFGGLVFVTCYRVQK